MYNGVMFYIYLVCKDANDKTADTENYSPKSGTPKSCDVAIIQKAMAENATTNTTIPPIRISH
jgi:hypothetical protein